MLSVSASTAASSRGQWSVSASWPMNSPRWPPGGRVAQHVGLVGGRVIGQREHLAGRRDVIGRAGQQVQRAGDPAEVDALVADLQRAGDQLVVTEQVLDDPQVERARDRLGVLEPVLELAVALHVRRIVDVGQQRSWRPISLSGWIMMKPASMCSPLSVPSPAATSAR